MLTETELLLFKYKMYKALLSTIHLVHSSYLAELGLILWILGYHIMSAESPPDHDAEQKRGV